MLPPGSVRDAIVEHLAIVAADQSVEEIHAAVVAKLGTVGATSVRSYLRLNSPPTFERMARGRYRLSSPLARTSDLDRVAAMPVFVDNLTKLYHADCFD